ncbi:hypothetical protein QO002_002186 [Pararhizobium capsulatum DSM 1112]|uniref:Uncharacterized protein n=1 Tax=Pararhizobium capsulatum DSM 1112 TaxID=1121113 RepID=A0ABU0BQ38_9HYPH|nr:hypothetical protein [Pararhizobium capsulatum]MDQ0320048.1 hypothetical protein [Pararhizobium capsulatum DSM 1112]
MNAQLHIDGSFQAIRQALDEANREFTRKGADRHRDALQRLGRVVMNSFAEIIETDGGTDGYLYDADGIAQDIESCYHALVVQEEADEEDLTPRQSSHGTLNVSQQGLSR